MNNIPTISELLKAAQSELTFSDSARLDAELLLCHVMNTQRELVSSRPEQQIPQQKIEAYRSLVNRQSKGYPIAYLTGHKEFWSTELSVNEHTLIPRPETECLVECVLEMIPTGEILNLIDLGTGSGAIAIAIAKERPQCKIIATDINDKALEIAATNAKAHALENISFIKSDWFSTIARQEFDFIVSNPPYIRFDDKHLQQGDVRFEPVEALKAGCDGLQYINEIIDHAPDYLINNGWLLLEHGYDQGHNVRTHLASSCYSDVTTRHDYAGNERITLARHQV
jgi:release factor glutamine methyltransferase